MGSRRAGLTGARQYEVLSRLGGAPCCAIQSVVRTTGPPPYVTGAIRPLGMLLAVCCCLSATSGQWPEKTIALSDTFGDIWPVAIYCVPSSNCV